MPLASAAFFVVVPVFRVVIVLTCAGVTALSVSVPVTTSASVATSIIHSLSVLACIGVTNFRLDVDFINIYSLFATMSQAVRGLLSFHTIVIAHSQFIFSVGVVVVFVSANPPINRLPVVYVVSDGVRVAT